MAPAGDGREPWAAYGRSVEQINALILQAVDSPWLLMVMLGSAIVDGVLPPIPSESILIAAVATASSSGDLGTVAILCLVAAFGAMIGDNLAYLLGRTFAGRIVGRGGSPRRAAAIDRARRSLEEHGAPVLLSARFVPVGRVAVNLGAGALRYPWPRFTALSLVACSLWAVYSAGIGAIAGQWLGEQPLLSALVGVGAAAGIGFAVDRIRAARQTGEDDPTAPLEARDAATAAEPRRERTPVGTRMP